MASIYNCDSSELIEKAAEELKKIESIKPPAWAPFVKTGMHKERPPANNDWWYMRAASVLRQIYRYGPIGVPKLRMKYGGKKNRGVKPERFYRGSGNILRKIMQQLEEGGFVKKELKGVHKGRLITAKGKKFLNDIAAKISKIIVEKPKEQKKEKGQEKEVVVQKREKKPEIKAGENPVEKTENIESTNTDKETGKK